MSPQIHIHTGLSSSSISLCEVTTLNHEALDNTVEGRVLVSVALLSSSQSAEVLDSLGDGLAVQSNDDSTHSFIAMSDVEVDLVGDLGALDSFSCLGKEGEGDGDDQQHRNDETLHGEHLCCSIDGVEVVYCGTKEIVGPSRGRRGGEREVVDELGYPARVSDRCRLGIELNHVLARSAGGQSFKAAFGKFKTRQHHKLNITTSIPLSVN